MLCVYVRRMFGEKGMAKDEKCSAVYYYGHFRWIGVWVLDVCRWCCFLPISSFSSFSRRDMRYIWSKLYVSFVWKQFVTEWEHQCQMKMPERRQMCWSKELKVWRISETKNFYCFAFNLYEFWRENSTKILNGNEFGDVHGEFEGIQKVI